jgi:hypothetical protein
MGFRWSSLLHDLADSAASIVLAGSLTTTNAGSDIFLLSRRCSDVIEQNQSTKKAAKVEY